MTRPLIQIGDEVREMTSAEYAQHQQDVIEADAALAAAATKAAERASALAKLSALGLTEAEITALVGA
jgi:hypothetical protein